MQSADPAVQDRFLGQTTGLAIPAHPVALQVGGAEFLTQAFHAYGSLPRDARVARIVHSERCAIGSTGEKLYLTLAFEPAAPGLPSEFFVKFSRHFSDPFHDRRRFELQSEIDFARLAAKPAFPIPVPRAFFGDYDGDSGTGLLITERIGFGQGGIEPVATKCMDRDLDRPLDYYRAVVTALARVAGAHHAGLLSPEVDRLFPFDLDEAIREDPIEYDEAQLTGLVADYAAFAAAHPQLMPAHLRTPEFLACLQGNVVAIARHQRTIKRYLHSDPRYIALTHFNPNLDNAWFWRDGSGELQCGLFDWQRARQMNVAYALWGGLSGADPELWDSHLDELLALFASEFHAHGGPLLQVETLALHLHLYSASIGTAGLLHAPSVVRSRLPEIGQTSGLSDPRLLANEGARCFLHVFTAYLHLLSMDGFNHKLDGILAGLEQDMLTIPAVP